MAQINLKVGEHFPVKAVFKDANGNNTDDHPAPVWSVSDPAVLAVDESDPATVRIVALNVGNATGMVTAGTLVDTTQKVVVLPGPATSVRIVAGDVGT